MRINNKTNKNVYLSLSRSVCIPSLLLFFRGPKLHWMNITTMVWNLFLSPMGNYGQWLDTILDLTYRTKILQRLYVTLLSWLKEREKNGQNKLNWLKWKCRHITCALLRPSNKCAISKAVLTPNQSSNQPAIPNLSTK